MLAALVYGASGDIHSARQYLQRQGDQPAYSAQEMQTMADLWIKDVELHDKISGVYRQLAEFD